MENDVELDDFIPATAQGSQHLPPKSWLYQTPSQSGREGLSIFSHHKYVALSNGHKAPDQDTFYKYAQELVCGTEDALRVIGKRRARPGHAAPNINHFRRFWMQMEVISQYWDTIEAQLAEQSSAVSGSDKHQEGNLYTGFRISSGAKMHEKYRIEAVKALVENLVTAFGCQMSPPRRVQQMQVKELLIPVTQSSMVWRTPGDKARLRTGIVEGPVLGMQCRNETAFVKDPHMALTDTARELAGLVLLAQERAREHKKKVIPGEGKWYTTKPRWGGGPGGEFGDAENRDKPPSQRQSYIAHSKQTDEEIWRTLQPGPGLWEPRVSYAAVGRDRRNAHDTVFMISSLYHHVSILRLDVHPHYIEFLETGEVPLYPDPSERWYMPVVRRTRWYDLLIPEDRGELLRGLWGVLSYTMRNDGVVDPRRPSMPQRQHSETSHFFSFRKKSVVPTHDVPARSHSIT